MHVHLCITAALSQVQQRPSRPLQLRPGSEFLNSVPSKVLKAISQAQHGWWVAFSVKYAMWLLAAHAIGNFLPWSIQCTQDPLYCNAWNNTKTWAAGSSIWCNCAHGCHGWWHTRIQSSRLSELRIGSFWRLCEIAPTILSGKPMFGVLIMFIYCLLQFTYGQLVATIKPKSEHTLCLVRGFEPLKLSNDAMLQQRWMPSVHSDTNNNVHCGQHENSDGNFNASWMSRLLQI